MHSSVLFLSRVRPAEMRGTRAGETERGGEGRERKKGGEVVRDVSGRKGERLKEREKEGREGGREGDGERRR